MLLGTACQTPRGNTSTLHLCLLPRSTCHGPNLPGCWLAVPIFLPGAHLHAHRPHGPAALAARRGWRPVCVHVHRGGACPPGHPNRHRHAVPASGLVASPAAGGARVTDAGGGGGLVLAARARRGRGCNHWSHCDAAAACGAGRRGARAVRRNVRVGVRGHGHGDG